MEKEITYTEVIKITLLIFFLCSALRLSLIFVEKFFIEMEWRSYEFYQETSDTEKSHVISYCNNGSCPLGYEYAHTYGKNGHTKANYFYYISGLKDLNDWLSEHKLKIPDGDIIK